MEDKLKLINVVTDSDMIYFALSNQKDEVKYLIYKGIQYVKFKPNAKLKSVTNDVVIRELIKSHNEVMIKLLSDYRNYRGDRVSDLIVVYNNK